MERRAPTDRMRTSRPYAHKPRTGVDRENHPG